jgi:hypothetical protein
MIATNTANSTATLGIDKNPRTKSQKHALVQTSQITSQLLTKCLIYMLYFANGDPLPIPTLLAQRNKADYRQFI